VSLTSAGASSAFVVKLSPAGGVLWARSFGGEFESTAAAAGVAADSAGNVAITGSFTGLLRLGAQEYSAGDGPRLFTTKLDAATGQPLWSRSDAAGSGAVTVDAVGNVLITGSFTGTLDLGGATVHSSAYDPDWPESTWYPDAFVAKFRGDTGNALWAKSMGEGWSADRGTNLRTNAAGQPVVQTWHYQYGLPWLSWTKLDANGAHLWTRTSSGWVKDYEGMSIDFDASGNVLLAGTFRGSVDFGGGLRDDCSFGAPNAALVWYGPNGEYVADKVFPCSFNNSGYTLPYGAGAGFDPSGNVVFTGWFAGSMKLGGSTVQAEGDSDIFLMKLDPSP